MRKQREHVETPAEHKQRLAAETYDREQHQLDRDAYADIAEELSDPQTTISDFESTHVKRAHRHSQRSHLAWPPHPTSSAYDCTIISWNV